MSIGTLITSVIHLVFAGLWTGSVLFVALAGLPEGGLSKLRQITRASAVLLLLTGGHQAAMGYGDGLLTGTTAGWAVIVMVVLWLALAGVVEVGASKYDDGGAEAAAPFWNAGAVVALLLLIDAGLLAGGL